MARIRTIKPEFFTSDTVTRLPLSARLTFVGLWTYADDEGRGRDDARLVKAAVWALDDDHDSAAVEADLAALAAADLVARYEVDGRRYLQIRGWREHQKVSHPRPSLFPPEPSPEPSGSSLENFRSLPEVLRPEVEVEREVEQGSGSERASAATTTGSPAAGNDHHAIAATLIRIVNRGQERNSAVDQQRLKTIPIADPPSVQQVHDWLSAGIEPETMASVVRDRTAGYKPRRTGDQINGLAYFDRPIRDAHAPVAAVVEAAAEAQRRDELAERRKAQEAAETAERERWTREVRERLAAAPEAVRARIRAAAEDKVGPGLRTTARGIWERAVESACLDAYAAECGIEPREVA